MNDGGKEGMTLRQWYAGQIINGMMASGYREFIMSISRKKSATIRKAINDLTELAFVFADAMVSEGQKGGAK